MQRAESMVLFCHERAGKCKRYVVINGMLPKILFADTLVQVE